MRVCARPCKWDLQDPAGFRIEGNSWCVVELPKDNSTLNVHNRLQMVHHNIIIYLLQNIHKDTQILYKEIFPN